MILVVMYAKTFKTYVIVFLYNIIMFEDTQTDNFQYPSQSVDTENIPQ